MYVHSVKLINYKSIGDYPEAELLLEPRITAIIGQNESGKSNIIDGLSRIKFIARNTAAFQSDIVNRNEAFGKANIFQIILKPSSEDNALGICEDTHIELIKDSCIVTGGFLAYFEKEIRPTINILLLIIDGAGRNPLQLTDQELINYRTYYSELKADTKIDIPLRIAAFNFLFNKVGKLPSEKQTVAKPAIETARQKWLSLISLLPTFFHRRTTKHLNSLYKFEDIDKELRNPDAFPNSLLNDFIRLIDISKDDFIHAARVGTATTQETVRNRIRRMITTKINTPFFEFYNTEEIYLDISFNNGTVLFMVQSGNGESFSISERSNGLRWYLETFIDAQANGVAGNNVVYLFDEPGSSLHVNAQNKLLELFGHLADKGNQVVYTTHSPYMLNTNAEGVHRIRAVVKNIDGYSYIYKSAYDARIAPASQQDTLTPIIKALGMNLSDTFGPAKDKINIVTEGMSDYIYLSTMAKHLDINLEKYALIPSVGATNCVNICAILHGWGCKYIALFDFDKKGVESGGEYLRKEMFFEFEKQYCYVREVTEEEIAQKVYKTSEYEIEDVVQQSEITRFCAETGTSTELGKPLTAKLLCTAIENGTFTICDQSIANFRELFIRIAKYTD